MDNIVVPCFFDSQCSFVVFLCGLHYAGRAGVP